jgi:predicted MFS family arabinose efflux permease
MLVYVYSRFMISPVLYACLVGLQQIVCWGTLTYAAAVYAPAMAAHTGISIASVMTAYGAGLLVNALVAPLCTRWVMRVGAWLPSCIGLALVVAACTTLSLASHWAGLLLGFMLAGAAMALTQYDFAFLTVKLYMPAHARRVISVMTFFGALASTIMWPVALALSTHVGVQSGWRYLALIAVLGSLPAVLWCYRLPRAVEGDSASTQTSPFKPNTTQVGNPVLVVVCIIGLALIGTSLVANLPLVLSQMQVAPSALASLLPLFGIGQLCGRALDFVGSTWLGTQATLLACMSALLLALVLAVMPQTSWWVSAAFVFLLGAGNGLSTILRGVVPQQLFAGAVFNQVSGWLASIGGLMRAVMPVVVAHIAVLTYGVTALVVIFSITVLGCTMLLIRPLQTKL